LSRTPNYSTSEEPEEEPIKEDPLEELKEEELLEESEEETDSDLLSNAHSRPGPVDSATLLLYDLRNRLKEQQVRVLDLFGGCYSRFVVCFVIGQYMMRLSLEHVDTASSRTASLVALDPGSTRFVDVVATAKAKIVNGEVQIQALVDGKKVIVTETSVRRALQLKDVEEPITDEAANEGMYLYIPMIHYSMGRKIVDLDADAEEVEVKKVVSTAKVITVSATTTTFNELTLAQTLIKIKTAKPKAVTTTATTTTTVVTRLKARGVVVQEPQLSCQKQREEDANITEWHNVQAMIDADYELAARLQAQEQEALTVEEKSKLFVELMDKRKKHFERLRAEEQRRKPPTKAQKRN
ncbi:hypothetical protein Tco_0690318, partial [Tanacetum coccineum]